MIINSPIISRLKSERKKLIYSAKKIRENEAIAFGMKKKVFETNNMLETLSSNY
jgi:hypothetical protein